MHRQPTKVTITQGEPSPSFSNFHSGEELSPHETHTDWAGTETDWADEEDSDSGSVTNEIQAPPHIPRRTYRPQRVALQQSPYLPMRGAPIPPSSVDPTEEYGHFGQHFPPQQNRGGFRGRGNHLNYPQSHAPGYGYQANQMVAQGYPTNPFGQMSGGSNSSGYYNHDMRQMYGGDMMHYQQPIYGMPHAANALPAYLQQFHISPPGMHPEHHAQSLVPAIPPQTESAAPDPEKRRLEEELAAFKAQQEKAQQVERQKEIEAQIRRDAEASYQKRIEEIRKLEEETKKEIERARAEAERTARDRIEAERRAEEERIKQHAEAMRQAEEKARLKFEAEMKAAEAKRKKDDEERAKAEEAAKIRLEAAVQAQLAARAEAEKKVAEEAERLKLIQEDAKRKAEAEAAKKVQEEKDAAEKKAAAEAEAKKAHDALKKKIAEETEAKLKQEATKNAEKEKAPIKFKDALNRKFSFPFHICAKWAGMEELIKQAFQAVDVLGPQVQEGWYDLIGPNGDIILPSVWERTIQPDWSITMAMWPMDRFPPGHGRFPIGGRGRGAGIPIPPPLGGHHGIPDRRTGGLSGGVMPPPGWPGLAGRRPAGTAANIDIIDTAPKPNSKSKRNSAVYTFFSGKPSSKKKSSKK